MCWRAVKEHGTEMCCAHLMGKVKLKTRLLVASGLAKGLCQERSQCAALWLGGWLCSMPCLAQFGK